jgi:hypothetical protein
MFKTIKIYDGSNNIVLEDEEYGYDEFTLKWDGCVDYRKGSNGVKPSEDYIVGSNNVDYMHICDLDDLIAKLQALRELGRKHFNNEAWK